MNHDVCEPRATMNALALTAEARDALIDAAMRGQRQAFGIANDSAGGKCALAVLSDACGALYVNSQEAYDFAFGPGWAMRRLDPPCGCSESDLVSGAGTAPIILCHLNDAHRWDFVTIARKLG